MRTGEFLQRRTAFGALRTCQENKDDLGPQQSQALGARRIRMVSPQILSKVTSAQDHRQALGGYVHLPPTFIFTPIHRCNRIPKQSTLGRSKHFKESTAWNQHSISFTGPKFSRSVQEISM